MNKKITVWFACLLTIALFVTACNKTKVSSDKTVKELPELVDIRDSYSIEQARTDGCVIIDNTDLIYGDDIWTDFFNKFHSGVESTVRVYQSYSEENSGYIVKELQYDGEKYILRFYDPSNNSGEEAYLTEEEYSYLNRSIHVPSVQTGDLLESCLLSDDPDANAEEYLAATDDTLSEPDPNAYGHSTLIYSRIVDGVYAIEAQYGVAFLDVDNDGTREECHLGMGATSGVFTFTLTAFDNDEKKYESTYMTEFYYLSFAQSEDDKVQIKAVTQGDAPQTKMFDIKLRDNTLVLVDGNTDIFPMSDSGIDIEE